MQQLKIVLVLGVVEGHHLLRLVAVVAVRQALMAPEVLAVQILRLLEQQVEVAVVAMVARLVRVHPQQVEQQEQALALEVQVALHLLPDRLVVMQT